MKKFFYILALLSVSLAVFAQATGDSIANKEESQLRFPIPKNYVENYNDLGQSTPASLPIPDNVVTEVVYDPDTDRYYFQSKVGDEDLGTPFYLTSDEFAEILKAEKETGKVFTVYQNRRWDRDYLAMKKLYESGALGDVHRIEHRVHGSRGIPGDWRQYPEFGGGMILDWGVHILDQMVLLVGESVKSVYCSTDNVTNELVDDGFNIRLKFESGVEAVLEVGTSNFIALPKWYMLGRNGSAVIRGWHVDDNEVIIAEEIDNTDIVPVITATGITKTMAPRKPEQFKSSKLEVPESSIDEFYYNFMAACKGEAEQAVKNEQVMRIMKIIEAAFKSAKTNQVVYFE